ncbi:unnamed protein product [Hydatigera taeniaeformis]|uniref:EGF-like domain-containing protein n=1 Tax=Hydatigena taeniaeformis TaxID=6205 RepID=A0A0R3WU29_HYDTA|nr:unnamed protein product [Hydatigera taeniaeformis]
MGLRFGCFLVVLLLSKSCGGLFLCSLCDEDVDECSGEPCRNGGKCVNTPGSFVCRCPVGFEGRVCESRVDPCDSTYGPVCANGGACITVNNRATCRCAPGFSGSRCEVCQLPIHFVFFHPLLTDLY